MRLEDFKTMIDKVPLNVRLDFSGQAEPWVNPACTDMFEYAMQKGFKTAIFTTLYNWDEDTVHRMGELLVKYADQIEILKFHFPDEAGNMKGWKHSEAWEYAYIGLTTILGHTGIYSEAMAMSDHGVHPAIRHLPGIGMSHSWSVAAHDRAGTLDTDKVKAQPVKFGPKHTGPIKCSKTEYYNQNVLLPNGEVAICCMDYAKKHIVGNLLEHSYEKIFTSPGMQYLLEQNAKTGYTNNTLCRSCTDAIPA
jgi:radical SAM protein with 4Fe4S-binding SPASM domain